jgi:hypothetical protein
LLGTLQVHIDAFGPQFLQGAISLAGTNSVIGIERPGEPASFRFVDVDFIAPGPAEIALRLDGDSDTGAAGDNLTRLAVVTLVGDTQPGRQVLLDVDGDGFDDGTTTADPDGKYFFGGVALAEGANAFKVQTSSDAGPVMASLVVVRDSSGPVGELTVPLPETLTKVDLGYVEVLWSVTGAAALDAASLDKNDVTVSGGIGIAMMAICCRKARLLSGRLPGRCSISRGMGTSAGWIRSRSTGSFQAGRSCSRRQGRPSIATWVMSPSSG